MPFLESFNLERLGERLAELESENEKMRRGPMCDALGLMFFDISILPDGKVETEYRSHKGSEIFAKIPSTYKEMLKIVHPSDQETLLAAEENFARVRLRNKNGVFHWYFIKCIITPSRVLGVLFESNCVSGFGLGIDIAPPCRVGVGISRAGHGPAKHLCGNLTYPAANLRISPFAAFG